MSMDPIILKGSRFSFEDQAEEALRNMEKTKRLRFVKIVSNILPFDASQRAQFGDFF